MSTAPHRATTGGIIVKTQRTRQGKNPYAQEFFFDNFAGGLHNALQTFDLYNHLFAVRFNLAFVASPTPHCPECHDIPAEKRSPSAAENLASHPPARSAEGPD